MLWVQGEDVSTTLEREVTRVCLVWLLYVPLAPRLPFPLR